MRSVKAFVLPLPRPPANVAEVAMPQYARVLSVGIENGELTVWALVDTTANVRAVRFKIVTNNQPMEELELEGFGFLGSVLVAGVTRHIWLRR